MALKPIDSPRTSPDFRLCQASSSLSFNFPGSSTLAISACTSMPLSVTLADLTHPVSRRRARNTGERPFASAIFSGLDFNGAPSSDQVHVFSPKKSPHECGLATALHDDLCRLRC